MNIFILDEDPRVAVQYLSDQHVNKMTLETVQILCDVSLDLGQPVDTVPYKHTKGNQLPQKWIIQSRANWDWATIYLNYLNERFYLKSFRNHGAYDVMKSSFIFLPKDGPLTPFPLTWNDDMYCCWVPADPLQSHRDYYCIKYNKWKSQGKKMTWDTGTKPDWI